MAKVKGQWVVDDTALAGRVYDANTVPEDAEIARIIRPAHEKVLTYVNSVIGTSKQAMSAATSRYEDTAAMDFINYVQGDAVRKALAGTADATTPMLSIAAPFNKAAAIPAGDVTVRDVAGLYIYDNTLLGIKLTGAQVQGLPRVLGSVLQAAWRAPARSRPTRSPTRPPPRHRTAPPTTTTTSWAGSTRR